MAKISVTTGEEWHLNAEITAQVFVSGKDVTENWLSHWPQAKLLAREWEDVQGSKPGKWCTSEYEIPVGTVLKVWFSCRYKWQPESVVVGWYRVTEGEPLNILGPLYADRGGRLYGPLERIPGEEVLSWSEQYSWIKPPYWNNHLAHELFNAMVVLFGIVIAMLCLFIYVVQ